jgi:cell division protein ZapE
MTLADAFQAELARHGHRADAAQLTAIGRLEQLASRLRGAVRREQRALWRLRAALGRMPPRQAVPGVYLWGGVGRGKTLLMDFCYGALEVPARRVHFHRFMHDVHGRLRWSRAEPFADPLARVAAELAAGIRVLCFDELQVGDIADAMLLAGLIEGLLALGVTLVCTSNVPPSGLYAGGLQRTRFLPAIALLERVTTVLEVDGGIDYRLRILERAPLYLELGAGDSEALLRQRFEAIAGEPGTAGGVIVIDDREIPVERRATGIIWFEFRALCAGARSTADYIEIARQHHTVVISGVPVFGPADDDAARRFVALVDECYDRGVKLALSAAAPADGLYGGERVALDFCRTASRLAEMQSHDYLARPHRA